MMPAPHYIVHETGYERDGYILKSLLAHTTVILPPAALRRTEWHVCWVALNELTVGDETRERAEATVRQLAEALRAGEPIEPILVIGHEKQLLVGHLQVEALRALGEKCALAYHGEWLDLDRVRRAGRRTATAA